MAIKQQKREKSPKSQRVSDKEIVGLIEKAGKQYRVYKELHDFGNFIRNMPKAERHDKLPLSSELPYVNVFNVKNKGIKS